MSKEIIQCVICEKNIEHRSHNVWLDGIQGRVYWTQGNNAQPVADGRCCDACDCFVVIPFRMGDLVGDVRQAIYFGQFEYKQRLERYRMNENENRFGEE